MSIADNIRIAQQMGHTAASGVDPGPSGTRSYIADFFLRTVTLSGTFTAAELREIADAMDPPKEQA